MKFRAEYLAFILFSLVLFPGVLGCTAPVFFNEYDVPIPMFGIGLTTINASKYPDATTIDYEFAVMNANNQSLTVLITPSEVLEDYIEAKNITVGPDEKIDVSLKVDLISPPSIGSLQVVGICEDGTESVVGTVNVALTGRGEEKKLDLKYLFILIGGAILVLFIILLILKKKKWGK